MMLELTGGSCPPVTSFDPFSVFADSVQGIGRMKREPLPSDDTQTPGCLS